MLWTVVVAIMVVLAVADALGFLLWYACSWPRSQILGPALIRGLAKTKQIALTFDDGPLPPYTEQILDILHTRKVQATFFVCGKDVVQHPETLRRMHFDGHTIGNHTWSHVYLYFLSRKKIAEEIDRTQQVIHQVTGHTPRLFRPPYGGRWFGLYPFLRKRGMQLVQWSVSGDDWKLKSSAIVSTVRAGLRPGAIILLHDGRQKPGGYLQRIWSNHARRMHDKNQHTAGQHDDADANETVKAVTAIIDAAQATGYAFVSVDDLLPAAAEAEIAGEKIR